MLFYLTELRKEMEASNRRSCGVSFILVDTAIIVKERLNHTQCLTIQPPMLKHSQGQVPGYIPQQTGYYVTKMFEIVDGRTDAGVTGILLAHP